MAWGYSKNRSQVLPELEYTFLFEEGVLQRDAKERRGDNLNARAGPQSHRLHILTYLAGNSGLDLFTFRRNVAAEDQVRYATYLIQVLVFFFTSGCELYQLYYTIQLLYNILFNLKVWFLYNILRHFIITRQHWTERKHSESVQANTILVTGVPSKHLTTQNALFKLFNSLPRGVKKFGLTGTRLFPFLIVYHLSSCVWQAFPLPFLLSHNQMSMTDVLRHSTYSRSAEASLLKAATKLRLKASIQDSGSKFLILSDQHPNKLGFLGLHGQKVDSMINWARHGEEIATCTQLLGELGEGGEKLRDDDEELRKKERL